MAQFGSNLSIGAQNRSAVTDSNGNLIVSPDDGFGGSPLGVAARTQALYGIPNANFDILPPNAYEPITVSNPLPYWNTEVNGLGTATMVYTDATQSWAVRLDPTEGTAAGEFIALKTRTYLLNDSNLTLRQKAFASITKVGTQATSEWDLVLSATYYDEAGTQLSTFNIGTANSGSAWTTINGFTTSGTAAIDPAAHYADLALTLTTSGSVAGTAMVDINSLLLQTSTGAAGAQSFLLTETFNSSGTFTVPTGVDYVTVVAIAAGQGGGGGGNSIGRIAIQGKSGGAGGATGYYALVRDIYVGDVGTVSVGIGAGGSGGTAFVYNKAAGVSTTNDNNPSTGSDGGNTTFGTYLTISGARTAPSGFFDLAAAAGATGGAGGGTAGGSGANGGTHAVAAGNVGAPFTAFLAGGVAGGTATGSGGTGANGNGGAAGTALGLGGAGGGGGGANANPTTPSATAGAGGIGGPGGGASGGGAAARYSTVTATLVATAGAGANAPANTGGGGGGGGACAIAYSGTAQYVPSTITSTSGAGGTGGSGLLKVIYVG